MGTVMADNALIEISAGGQVSLTPVIRLWPDGPPSGLPGVGSEITFPSPAIFGPETDMLRNVSDPSLTVFVPDPAKANGVGAIVCPAALGGCWPGSTRLRVDGRQALHGSLARVGTRPVTGYPSAADS